MGFYLQQRPTTLLCPSMVRTQGASCNISHPMMMMMTMISIIIIIHLITFEVQVFTLKKVRLTIEKSVFLELLVHGCLLV